MNARELVEKLSLVPHPEGGWYREIYRARERTQTRRGLRSTLTTIHYLLEQGQLSRWHVVQSDEVWHFYGGAPLELLEYDPAARRFTRHVLGGVVDGTESVVPHRAAGASPASRHWRLSRVAPLALLGIPSAPLRLSGFPPLRFGCQDSLRYAPVAVIEAGVWQAARSGGEFSLVGCTVGPGFEFEDFRFVDALPGHAAHFTGELAGFTDLL